MKVAIPDPKTYLWQNICVLMKCVPTIDAVTAKTGVGRGTIQRIKEAKTSVGTDVLVSIADALEVDLAQLLALNLGSSSAEPKTAESASLAELLSRLTAELAQLPPVQYKMALSSMRDFAEHPENWQQLAAELQVLGVRMGLPSEPQREAPVTAPTLSTGYFKGRPVYGDDQVPERRATPSRRNSGGA